jgi:acyl-coenzyme A synthetase/AMP-(fatty) acid ligase
MKEGRDLWLQPLLDAASDNSIAEIMDSEDPLFIIYFWLYGKTKGMVHTTAGIWYKLPHLKCFLIMKKMMFSGAPLI